MTLYKVSEGFAEKMRQAEVYDHVASSYGERFVQYVINRQYRKSVGLVRWLNKFLQNPSDKVLEAEKQINNYNSHDKQALVVRQWVEDNIEYVGDKELWDTVEYWATPEETLEKGRGDCEDGAILAYVLCRLKGVPANRLMLFAGDVVGGGHCWLAYRPSMYPLNWAFLDWCYWETGRSMDTRQLFYVDGKSIEGFEHREGEVLKPYDSYESLWFAFNEDKSHLRFNYSY